MYLEESAAFDVVNDVLKQFRDQIGNICVRLMNKKFATRVRAFGSKDDGSVVNTQNDYSFSECRFNNSNYYKLLVSNVNENCIAGHYYELEGSTGTWTLTLTVISSYSGLSVCHNIPNKYGKTVVKADNISTSILPVVELIPEVTIQSGMGTKDDPYILRRMSIYIGLLGYNK